MDALHHDVDGMIKAAESVKPIAERLGVPPPKPHIAGFCYTPLAAMGAEVVFPPGSEPKVLPIITKPEDIDCLEEPADYLAADLIRRRLDILARLRERCPEASGHIGHNMEGPITTAMLLMGTDFLFLIYEDTERAHKLLDFSVRATINYSEAIRRYFGREHKPGVMGLPDDFSGMLPPSLFDEYVVPYTNRLYEALQATSRHLHSELLQVPHLKYLTDMKIDQFDPSADQYLNAELLKEHCPCRFMLRIMSWHVNDMSPKELQDHYRYLASFNPTSISFSLWRLADEPKVKALLEVAREMKGD